MHLSENNLFPNFSIAKFWLVNKLSARILNVALVCGKSECNNKQKFVIYITGLLNRTEFVWKLNLFKVTYVIILIGKCCGGGGGGGGI